MIINYYKLQRITLKNKKTQEVVDIKNRELQGFYNQLWQLTRDEYDDRAKLELLLDLAIPDWEQSSYNAINIFIGLIMPFIVWLVIYLLACYR